MKKFNELRDQVGKQQKFIFKLHEDTGGIDRLQDSLKNTTFMMNTMRRDVDVMNKTFTPAKFKKIDNLEASLNDININLETL